MQGTQFDNSTTSLQIDIFSMLTLMEEIKPVFLVKYEFENGEQLKLKCFLWKIRNIRLLMQDRKTVIVLVEYSSTSAAFSIEILMEEIERVVAQK